MTELTVEQRLTKLEQIIDAMRMSLVAGSSPNGSGHAASPGAVADDDLLNRDWADMEIRKDPPRTTQPSHVGKHMSECTEAYLLDYASFHEWKAKKGREETPVRLNNKGKPWYESDDLIAKVARGWAARVRATGVAAPKAAARVAPQITPVDADFEDLPNF